MTMATQLYALSATQSHLRDEEVQHLKAMLAEKVLEIERLRMQVEDLRQAQISDHIEFPGTRYLTWRERATRVDRRLTHAYLNNIAPALGTVKDAIADINTLGTPTWPRHLMHAAHLALCDVERYLEDVGEDEDEEVEEEAEEESVATGAADLGDAIEQDSDSDQEDMDL